MSRKPTERDIQRFIYGRNHPRYIVLMPNYTPCGWWECDLFGVTKAGYFHEFEIKLTVADFRKDARKKAQDSWKWVDGVKQTIPGITKHSQIGQAIGPARFWYVTPVDLIGLEDVPEWAGWQTFKPSSLHSDRYAHVRTMKPAPQIHKTKIADSIIRHSMSVCYYRYWHERNAHDDTRHDYRLRETYKQMAEAAR